MVSSLIFDENLFEKVLLDPAKMEEADELCIVSGFATPAMVCDHLSLLEKIQIRLIVGMTPACGIKASYHENFTNIQKGDLFTCHYMDKNCKPVHSKVYVWLKSERPIRAFVGSPNYTRQAFRTGQGECVCECCPSSAYEYYKKCTEKTLMCSHIEADEFCRDEIQKNQGNYVKVSVHENMPLEECKLPLYAERSKKMHNAGAGLNWGQPAGKRCSRNKNEAYIPIPKKIADKGFFPEKGEHFTVYTDDNKSFICVVAQGGDKAIETPLNNSLLGEYFRRRLGVELGAFVELKDLDRYGRRDVTFVKLDEEDYYMDFSKL